MTFAEKCNEIFDKATVEYHKPDNIDFQVENPYSPEPLSRSCS